MANKNPKTDHLVQFQKGVSGNPKGLPKGTKSPVALLKRVLLSNYTKQTSKKLIAQLKMEDHKDILPQTQDGKISPVLIMNLALIKKGMEGDVPAIKEIYNRIDGLPKQVVIQKNENLNVDITASASSTEAAKKYIDFMKALDNES